MHNATLVVIDVQCAIDDPSWARWGDRSNSDDCWVVSDATATFARPDYDGILRTAAEVHAMSLANLDGEYATIATTEEILAWLEGSGRSGSGASGGA